MMNLKFLMIALVAMSAMALEAAVSVKDVTAVQRWPWNGLVDVDYTVVADDANADVYVFPEGTDNDTKALLQMRTLTGEGANGAVKPGKHRMTWNALADMPNYHTTSFSVRMTAISGAAPYVVIDLSGGSSAASYPVRFSASGPDLSSDTCRTTELWLRLILPGTFTMGSPSGELGRSSDETQLQVTISKPFYIGVFELTQKQWRLVMETTPSSCCYDTLPVERVSYDMIRGTMLGAAWPSHRQVDADSFLGKIRARTLLTIDLPTEAQWEYACRAGTTTALNNGKNLSSNDSCLEMDEVGRYSRNRKDGKGGDWTSYTKVGSYAANAWGLYDMHGNVQEWCLDWYYWYGESTSVLTDPLGMVSGTHRVTRGGGIFDDAKDCRSASRSGLGSASTGTGGFYSLGCRLVMILPQAE